MKKGTLWITLISLAIVLLLFYLDTGRISPGELAASHARLPELDGSSHCIACHGEQVHSMADSCFACHQEIGEQLNRKKGFHNQIPASEARDCARCHSEHHGPQFPLAGPKSFAAARVPEMEKFDHVGLDYRLAGKHLSLSCESCHKFAKAESLEKGQKRFLGLEQRCTSCHQDVHKGAFGADCASCHGQVHAFGKVAEFHHTESFRLEGAHEGPSCSKCHEPGSDRAVDFLTAWKKKSENSHVEVRVCQACHVSPHRAQFLSEASRLLQTSESKSCEHCHESAHQGFLAPVAKMEQPFHDGTGFPLSKPHDKLRCEQCHKNFGQHEPGLEFTRTYPGRKPDDCKICHGDPHHGDFASGVFKEKSCLDCHGRQSFTPSAFTLDQHKQTRFPLTGAHGAVACQACHKESQALGQEPEPYSVRLQFHGAPTKCESCHEDVHRGQFNGSAFPAVVKGETGCARCHSTDSFKQSTGAFDHTLWAQFELEGAHAKLDCASCHTPFKSPNSQGRTFARAAGKTCESCHKDVHQGSFDKPEFPKQINGAASCARCHNSESFQRFTKQFEHKTWTNFELRGSHAALQCNACHARLDTPDPAGRRFGRALGTSCESCHADPHLGQFRENGKVDCARCHTETPNFKNLLFDHQKQSRFRLDADHARLDCGACHKTYTLPDRKSLIRYKPLGIRCADCHDPREGKK